MAEILPIRHKTPTYQSINSNEEYNINVFERRLGHQGHSGDTLLLSCPLLTMWCLPIVKFGLKHL